MGGGRTRYEENRTGLFEQTQSAKMWEGGRHGTGERGRPGLLGDGGGTGLRRALARDVASLATVVLSTECVSVWTRKTSKGGEDARKPWPGARSHSRARCGRTGHS